VILNGGLFSNTLGNATVSQCPCMQHHPLRPHHRSTMSTLPLRAFLGAWPQSYAAGRALPGVALGAGLQWLFLHRRNGDERNGEARRGDKE
jgi:hypothetical protein